MVSTGALTDTATNFLMDSIFGLTPLDLTDKLDSASKEERSNYLTV